MWLERLRVEKLRSLKVVDVHPSSGLNVVFGPNGSGKTSLLEAIYLLGMGRSFRSRTVRDVVSRGEARLTVFGQVVTSRGETRTVGVERGRGEARNRVSGEDVRSASELAKVLPTLLITPESQRLLTDGGRLRRRMMDWALFHVEPGYNVLLQRYRLSLRQRNACLRQQSPYAALTAWTKELETHAIELHRMRSRFAEEVRPSLDEMIGGLLGREVEVRYRPGWNTEEPLSVRLERSLQSDLSRGHTGYGPHRADIRFTVDGSPAQHVLSRGEAKLFVAAVLLAQTSYVVSRAIQVPVVLMDDLPSELDAVNRSRLLGALMACNAQVFLTTVSRDLLETGEWEAKKMFHVEQGSVCEMV